MTVRVGLTLPSFTRDVDEVLAVAAAAEAAELDGVFVFDHLFRRARDGSYRPALESTALLGALAAATSRIQIGVLVARASLRPAAVTASAFATLHRACGRLVGAIGAGDSESRAENEHFGLPFGTFADRLAALRATTVAARDQGFPVWVGGTRQEVRALAADEADGWNRWGGSPERFGAEAAGVYARARRSPFECTWGGLVVVDRDDARARAKAARLAAGPGTLVGGPATLARLLAAYREAGARWVVAGPVDSHDPANAALLGEARTLLTA